MSSLTRSIRRGIMFKGLNKKQKRQKSMEMKTLPRTGPSRKYTKRPPDNLTP